MARCMRRYLSIPTPFLWDTSPNVTPSGSRICSLKTDEFCFLGCLGLIHKVDGYAKPTPCCRLYAKAVTRRIQEPTRAAYTNSTRMHTFHKLAYATFKGVPFLYKSFHLKKKAAQMNLQPGTSACLWHAQEVWTPKRRQRHPDDCTGVFWDLQSINDLFQQELVQTCQRNAMH